MLRFSEAKLEKAFFPWSKTESGISVGKIKIVAEITDASIGRWTTATYCPWPCLKIEERMAWGRLQSRSNWEEEKDYGTIAGIVHTFPIIPFLNEENELLCEVPPVAPP